MLTLAGKWMRLAGICLVRSEITMRQVIPHRAGPLNHAAETGGRTDVPGGDLLDGNIIILF